MIVFYTEEDYQREIEAAEDAARKELTLVILKQLDKLKERVDEFYGKEEAAGIAMAIGTVVRVAKIDEIEVNEKIRR